ncbi:hypothetical protein [Stakelama tenebrarum]|uniref:Uncharacterized protein n=1 Tax=Stakelama tenebrarum TaxID=2711215 RepID=A0A6G6Y2B5_9SPHN|nr:hypothetical protein [Sphingosinithalassobacter tenebrarum]QIG79065.1 hypothetical protein G5C33_04210 [Sphingosinithalassobacter tenebrarum]
MLATRPHLLDQYFHMPDTAWASFFVLGYFVRNRLAFPALFALGFAIDVVVIYLLGGSGFCFTPAYWMLVPAYGTMWFAGRFAARNLEPTVGALPAFALLATAAAFVAHCFSSGGFYLLSGHFDQPTLAEFAGRVARYFPGNLVSMWIWLGIAALCHTLWTRTGGQLPTAARRA